MARVSYPQALRVLVEADSGAPAFVYCDGRVGRGDFHAASNRMARVYLSLGVRAGDLVTIGLPNGIDWCTACMAAWKIGAIPNPVSHELPGPERLSIIRRAASALVVGCEQVPAPFRCLPVGYRPDDTVSAEDLPDCVSAHDRALASGGSTGVPKLILPNNPALFDSESPYNFFAARHAALVPGPLYHAIPFSTAWSSLFSGARVVIMPRFDPSACLALVEEHRVDRLTLVPTMMLRIMRLPEAERLSRDLSSLRFVLSSGSACPPWLMRAWIEWLGPEVMHETYGSSERIGGTFISGVEWLAHPGSVGKPVAAKMKIVDPETAEECPPGVVGEIYMLPLTGSGTTFIYKGSERRFDVEGWESVGDMGYLDEDGFLYIADRRTDMIVCRGRNIFPAELEAALEEHPAVRCSVVIGLPDEERGQRIHAIVELECNVSEQELRDHMKERLVHYKLPGSYEFVSERLRNDAGKVRRSELREQRMTAITAMR